MTDPFLKSEHVQGSADWLAHRKNHLGASDAPIVLGISPWKTPYQLWQDKLGLSAPQEETWAMRRGTEMEPIARAAFEELTGVEVFPKIAYHKEHKFMIASLDGVSLDGNVAVEIKCPGVKAHQTALNGNIPEHYMPQLQHQIACIGLEMIWYYSFDGEKGVALQVFRDEEYIDRMIEAEIKFWDCVKTKTPPPMMKGDYKDRDCPIWAVQGARVAEIDQQLKDLKKEREDIRGFLMDDADGFSSCGGGLMLTKSVVRGNVDYSSIPELEGVDLEQHRKASREQWTLKVSIKKDEM